MISVYSISNGRTSRNCFERINDAASEQRISKGYDDEYHYTGHGMSYGVVCLFQIYKETDGYIPLQQKKDMKIMDDFIVKPR